MGNGFIVKENDMSRTVRPRRSMLFMPGSNARAIEKAKTLAADGLILDLEDAVSPDAKAMARQQVAEAVCQGGYGKRELVVRVNALTTSWGREDLEAVATCGADAILLPKVESDATVHQTLELLAQHGAPEHVAIWCMLETPRGILRAAAIAAASPRVAALVMGTSDLSKELRASTTRDRHPLLPSLGFCVLVARAYGLVALDGVHLDLQDDAGFTFACRQAAEMGFDGKTLIHPKTLATANQVFAPSASEVAWSRRIIASHAEAMAAGQGIVVLDGRLIENLHVEDAQRVVQLAEAIADLEAETDEDVPV
jgi:citrate lyase subunit beta/citryl-CoA lyase